MARHLPSDLEAVLSAVRHIEGAATMRRQLLEAIHATTGLIHRARAEGWTCVDLAPALGLSVLTLRRRCQVAPADPDDLRGVAVTPPPPKPKHKAPVLPPADREWLTMPEALAVAGIKSKMTLYRWLRIGMLPNTQTERTRFLYSRADLEAVAQAPRSGRGISIRVRD
jgi:hypothetical protein